MKVSADVSGACKASQQSLETSLAEAAVCVAEAVASIGDGGGAARCADDARPKK